MPRKRPYRYGESRVACVNPICTSGKGPSVKGLCWSCYQTAWHRAKHPPVRLQLEQRIRELEAQLASTAEKE